MTSGNGTTFGNVNYDNTVLSYPDVHIVNKWSSTVHGTINFNACSSNVYRIDSKGSKSFWRGFCLLVGIQGTDEHGNYCQSYYSPGTTYSHFEIIYDDNYDGCSIKRI